MPFSTDTMPRRRREEAASIPGDTLHFFRFPCPLIIVTEHRGREVFTDSRKLFIRLQELPEIGGAVMQVNSGAFVLEENSVAAINEFLRQSTNWRYFLRAARTQPTPYNAPLTRFGWLFLGKYLGFEWRQE